MKLIDIEPVMKGILDWKNATIADWRKAKNEYKEGVVDAYNDVMNLLKNQPEILEPVEKVQESRKEFIELHTYNENNPVSINKNKIESVYAHTVNEHYICSVYLTSGDTYKVKESYEEVKKMLEGGD